MRLNVDAVDDLVIVTADETAPAFVLSEQRLAGVVTSTADSGAGTLRQAMTRLHAEFFGKSVATTATLMTSAAG